MSAWRLYEMFQYSQYEQARRGVPLDTGGKETGEWAVRFGNEFAARLARATDEPELARWTGSFFYALLKPAGEEFLIGDPQVRGRLAEALWPRFLQQHAEKAWQFDDAYLPALARHFTGIGQPGGERKLLAELDAASKARASKPPQSVRLPRLADLDPDESPDLLVFPALVFPPAAVALDVKNYGFASPGRAKAVRGMTWQGGRLWLAVETEEPLALGGDAGRLNRQLSPLSDATVRLWVLDPQGGEARRVDGPLATNRVNGIATIDGRLWLALDDAGLTEWDPISGTLHRLGTNEGLASLSQCAVVEAGGRTFALGGENDLFHRRDGVWAPLQVPTGGPGLPFAVGSNLRRVAGNASHLLLYNPALLAFDVRADQWSRLDHRVQSVFPGVTSLAVSAMISDGEGRFWVSSAVGLHRLDAATGEVWNQVAPVEMKVAGASKQIGAGLFRPETRARRSAAQVQTELQQRLKWRQQTLAAARTNAAVVNRFTTPTRLPGRVIDLAPDGEYVWVLAAEPRPNAYRLLVIHSLSLQWVGSALLDTWGALGTLAVSPDAVWLGTTYGPDAIIRRLALLPLDARLRPAADVLTAALSRRDGLALLERAQIEPVLAEQSLSRVNAGDYVKVGQLLGAQELLILELGKEGDRELVSARLVAVGPGVGLGLAQAPWPLEDLDGWTQRTVRQFDHLLPKLNVLARDAVPISILNVRAAIQSREAASLEQALTTLLARRLMQHPDIFVLERRQMETLGWEKELKDADASPFWSGSYLLEGTIDPEGFTKKTLTLRLRLSPPEGGTSTVIELAGPRANLTSIANDSASRILSGLSRSGPTPEWKPEQEAERYFEEAKWALRWKLYREAQVASSGERSGTA